MSESGKARPPFYDAETTGPERDQRSDAAGDQIVESVARSATARRVGALRSGELQRKRVDVDAARGRFGRRQLGDRLGDGVRIENLDRPATVLARGRRRQIDRRAAGGAANLAHRVLQPRDLVAGERAHERLLPKELEERVSRP
jgi:hypothetical protein